MEALYGKLSAPAVRALRVLDLKTVEELSGFTRKHIAGLHGIGPSTLRTMETELAALNLSFRKPDGRDRGE